MCPVTPLRVNDIPPMSIPNWLALGISICRWADPAAIRLVCFWADPHLCQHVTMWALRCFIGCSASCNLLNDPIDCLCNQCWFINRCSPGNPRHFLSGWAWFAFTEFADVTCMQTATNCAGQCILRWKAVVCCPDFLSIISCKWKWVGYIFVKIALGNVACAILMDQLRVNAPAWVFDPKLFNAFRHCFIVFKHHWKSDLLCCGWLQCPWQNPCDCQRYHPAWCLL